MEIFYLMVYFRQNSLKSQPMPFFAVKKILNYRIFAVISLAKQKSKFYALVGVFLLI